MIITKYRKLIVLKISCIYTIFKNIVLNSNKRLFNLNKKMKNYKYLNILS